MPLTKIKRGGLDTGITDNSDANALTFDSSENATFVGSTTIDGVAKISEAGSGNVLLETTQSSKYLQLKSNEGIYFQTNSANYNYIDSSNNFIKTSGHMRLDSDSHKFTAGAGQDFQFYHDGSNSRINNTTGHIIINQGHSSGNTEFEIQGSGNYTFAGGDLIVNGYGIESVKNGSDSATSGSYLRCKTASGDLNVWMWQLGASNQFDLWNYNAGGDNAWEKALTFTTTNLNATFAGTINSGAITSSGNVHLTPANSSGNATTVLNIGVGSDTNSNSSGTKHISQLQMEATFPLGDNPNPYTMGQIEVGNTAQDWNTAYMQFEVGNTSEALVLYGNKNALFGGGVGLRGTAPNATMALNVEYSTTNYIMKIQNDHATDGHGILLKAGDDSSVDSLLIQDYNGSNVNFRVRGDGTTYTRNIATFGGRVGIDSGGYTQQQLHVGDLGTLLLSHGTDTVGEYSGIFMRSEGGEENGMLRTKGLIAFERTGAYGVGDMKFCINGDGNNTAVTNSDVALKIDSSKNATFAGNQKITKHLGIGVDYHNDTTLQIENSDSSDYSYIIDGKHTATNANGFGVRFSTVATGAGRDILELKSGASGSEVQRHVFRSDG